VAHPVSYVMGFLGSFPGAKVAHGVTNEGMSRAEDSHISLARLWNSMFMRRCLRRFLPSGMEKCVYQSRRHYISRDRNFHSPLFTWSRNLLRQSLYEEEEEEENSQQNVRGASQNSSFRHYPTCWKDGMSRVRVPVKSLKFFNLSDHFNLIRPGGLLRV
jgi:hypothetical protein